MVETGACCAGGYRMRSIYLGAREMEEVEEVMKIYHIAERHPDKGTKFVAFLYDGSGAELFCRTATGEYLNMKGESYGGDDEWMFDIGYHRFAYLPDDLLLLFEWRKG